MASAATIAPRPTQRGVLCLQGFVGFSLASALLFALDPDARRWPVALFAASVIALMGTSGLYHRIDWSPTWYPRIRRLDHAMIFVLITGTELPLFVIGLEGRGLEELSYVAFGAAALGFLITTFATGAPKWLRALVYVGVGWSGIPAAPHLLDALGPVAVGLLVLGGLLYSVGALAYGLKRPNPWPGTFGYHEVFHAFVIAAAAAHFAAIAFFVV